MKEQMYFNEFVSEVCQNDIAYARETLQEWLDELNDTFDKYEEIVPYLKVELEDDETEMGGISYLGETLWDFLVDLGEDDITTLEEVNQALIENGIKPIKKGDK